MVHWASFGVRKKMSDSKSVPKSPKIYCKSYEGLSGPEKKSFKGQKSTKKSENFVLSPIKSFWSLKEKTFTKIWKKFGQSNMGPKIIFLTAKDFLKVRKTLAGSLSVFWSPKKNFWYQKLPFIERRETSIKVWKINIFYSPKNCPEFIKGLSGS